MAASARSGFGVLDSHATKQPKRSKKESWEEATFPFGGAIICRIWGVCSGTTSFMETITSAQYTACSSAPSPVEFRTVPSKRSTKHPSTLKHYKKNAHSFRYLLLSLSRSREPLASLPALLAFQTSNSKTCRLNRLNLQDSKPA